MRVPKQKLKKQAIAKRLLQASANAKKTPPTLLKDACETQQTSADVRETTELVFSSVGISIRKLSNLSLDFSLNVKLEVIVIEIEI